MPKPKPKMRFYAFTEIDGNNMNEITIAKTGKWRHSMYGDFTIDQKTLKAFKANFDSKTRKIDVGIDVEHRSYDGYVGWFKEFIIKGNALVGVVEWTRKGAEYLKEKTYRYFSPEIAFNYEDPETHETYENVIIGGGITNRPYFKGLKPLLASEGKSKTPDDLRGEFTLFFNEDSMPKYAELFAELSKKDTIEKAKFSELETLYNALSEEEKGEVEGKPEDLKDKVEDEGADAGDAGGDAGNGDGSNADTAKANEAKTLSEANAQIAKLSEEIAKLNKTQRTTQLNEKAAKVLASETNKEGALLPTAKEKLVQFFETLNDKQIDMFNELMGMRAKPGMFSEAGDSADEAGDSNDTPESVRNSELDKEAKQLVADGKFNDYESAVKSLSSKYSTARG